MCLPVCVCVYEEKKISAIFPSAVQDSKYRDLAGTGLSTGMRDIGYSFLNGISSQIPPSDLRELCWKGEKKNCKG